MASAFPPLDPEYDAFLYAVICREKNGMHLTTASAIARAGADPWKEAARIAKMPKDLAIQALTRLMPDQAATDKDATDQQITADRLLSLLPKRTYIPTVPAVAIPRAKGTTAIIVVALGAAVLVAYLFSVALRSDTEKPTGGPVSPSAVERTSD